MTTLRHHQSHSRISRYSLLLIAMGFAASASAGALSYDNAQGFEASASCNSGNAFAIDNSDVTLNGADATECFGAYSGNNQTSTFTWNSMTWNRIAKNDIIDAEDGGQSQQTSQQITVDFGDEVDADGDWSYSGDFSNWDSFFLVTKAGNPGWAAYYFDDLDGLNSLEGTFTIPWNAPSGKPPALSHLDLYAKTVAQVPEPATLGLMGLGLLGLGLRRSRR